MSEMSSKFYDSETVFLAALWVLHRLALLSRQVDRGSSATLKALWYIFDIYGKGAGSGFL